MYIQLKGHADCYKQKKEGQGVIMTIHLVVETNGWFKGLVKDGSTFQRNSIYLALGQGWNDTKVSIVQFK